MSAFATHKLAIDFHELRVLAAATLDAGLACGGLGLELGAFGILGAGDVSRFLDVRGPGLFNRDVSIFKTFSIREKIRAQFRAEGLNATNTVYFGNPGTTFTSSTFG